LIAFVCPICAKGFSVKDEFAGRKTKCPKCKTDLLVPTPVPAVVPPPVPAPVKTPAQKLMPCNACGQEMAIAAMACPKCGSPNNWLHPEIERFRNSFGQFGNMPAFKVNLDRFILSGTAEVKRGIHALLDFGMKLSAVGFLSMLLGAFLPGTLGILVPWVIGPLGLLGGFVIILVSTFGKDKTTDFVVSFVIDFSQSPPRWQSDDDEFWKDVKHFFLPSP
jgi:DNA-directed RNA polymerase subunit RPC12/RpoP